tara:strand:+ start:684 stop:1862 length:1179 start_codon:yes stop_codon:yes gene_type:complete
VIYLDNNSSTCVDPDIFDIFQDITVSRGNSNPHSSEHAYGWEASEIIEESKLLMSDYLNATPNEIYFTSGATESNNWAVIGTALSARKKSNPRNEILVSSIEHKCILNSAFFTTELFKEFKIIEVPVNYDGQIDIDKLKELISDKTLLVSIMTVNNEVGTVQPIKDIGSICKQYGAIFHTDAAQAAYTSLDVIENNVDMLSLSGHKVYAPKGVGALFISDDIPLKPSPILFGGGQQDGMRAGTLSPALCMSMAKALQKTKLIREDEVKHLSSLRKVFLKGLDNANVSYILNGCMNARHPGNLNIQIPRVDASTLITRLQPKIAISTGSACNSGVIKGSYVLKAIGLTNEEVQSSVRICFGRFNTESESIHAAKIISHEVHTMLSLSQGVSQI